MWENLVRAGRGCGLAEVKQLLTPDHWRPVVMGSWFSLKFSRDQIGDDLRSAISLCRGSLTAPPLSVAAAVVIGKGAVPALSDYIDRDHERQYGAAGFVAAVVSELGVKPALSPEDRDSSALASMLDVAHRLRSALV